MQNEEKLVFVQSDMLVHEEQFNSLRKRVANLTKEDIHNFMSFQCDSDNEIILGYLMTNTDSYDFSLHPMEILKETRKNDSILMSFKSLNKLLSL